MRAKSMMLASALVLGFGAMGSGSALAHQDGGQSATTEESATPAARREDTSRRVCRNLRPTGSRLGTRVCRTQADWDREAQQTQDGMRRHELENTIGTNPDTVRAGSDGRNI